MIAFHENTRRLLRWFTPTRYRRPHLSDCQFIGIESDYKSSIGGNSRQPVQTGQEEEEEEEEQQAPLRVQEIGNNVNRDSAVLLSKQLPEHST